MTTLYINRLTTVDCALLIGNASVSSSAKTQALGFSFNVSCKVSGKVDPIENVVVDFGALKKTMKSEIDNLEYGYDHKLIVGSDYDDVVLDIDTKNGTASIVDFDRNTLFIGPTNAIRKVNSHRLSAALDDLSVFEMQKFFLHAVNFGQYIQKPFKGLLPDGLKMVINGLEEELKDFLQGRLAEIYPDVDITVEAIQCDIQPTLPMECYDSQVNGLSPVTCFQMFPYTHGLKNSTSVGCKNLAHGHLSKLVTISHVDVNLDEKSVRDKMIAVQGLVNYIALEHFNAHFVWSDNLADNGISESYTAEGRGDFQIELNSSGVSSIVERSIQMDSESTIENLAAYMADKYGEALRNLGVSLIYVSEGLHKGSYVNVKSL